MIKVIIFDLDGTLYKSAEIGAKFAEAAYRAMSQFKNISFDDAKELIEGKRAQLRSTYGDPVPYTLTLKSFGMSAEHWHKENIASFDPRDFLNPDEQLRDSLAALRKTVSISRSHQQQQRANRENTPGTRYQGSL